MNSQIQRELLIEPLIDADIGQVSRRDLRCGLRTLVRKGRRRLRDSEGRGQNNRELYKSFHSITSKSIRVIPTEGFSPSGGTCSPWQAQA